jgi:hypothetical protein
MRLASFLTLLPIAILLSGCFQSWGNLVPAYAIVKPFPDSGRVEKTAEATDSDPRRSEILTFNWTGRGYTLTDSVGVERGKYELGDVGNGWLVGVGIAKTTASGLHDYALARMDGGQLRVYGNGCGTLNDSELAQLGVTVSDEGDCTLSSWDQLKNTMQLLSTKNLKLSETYRVQ